MASKMRMSGSEYSALARESFLFWLYVRFVRFLITVSSPFGNSLSYSSRRVCLYILLSFLALYGRPNKTLSLTDAFLNQCFLGQYPIFPLYLSCPLIMLRFPNIVWKNVDFPPSDSLKKITLSPDLIVIWFRTNN